MSDDAGRAELTEALAVAHRVAVLAETDPNAPLVVAVRAALEIADFRRTARRDRRVAGREVHGGDSAWWSRWADQWMPYPELAALRATPSPTLRPPAPEPEDENRSSATRPMQHHDQRPASGPRRGDRR